MDSLKGTLTPMKVLQGTLNGGIAYGTFNYNELENKPSVNGTELIGNVNIPIPTKTSDLTNDSGFITSANVPTKTSDLTNDSGFITDADIPTKTSELTNDSGFITSADIPTIPTNTSQLNNDSGFLTINTTPVRSVNSQTGDVNLFIPNATSQLNNDAGFFNAQNIAQTGTMEDVAIASFSDGADNVPVSSLIVDIDAVQDLHGYDKPWAGGAGKNLLNYDSWKSRLPITNGTAVWENNGVTLTATANDCYTEFSTEDAKIPMSEGETITLSWQESTNKNGIIVIFPNALSDSYVSADNARVKKISYTATSGVNFITFRFGVAYSGDTIAYKNIQIEKGSSPTDYAPYSNICPITGHDSGVITVADNDQITNTYAVDFGQTVYGGTLNVTTGLLTITHGYISSYNGEPINEPWISSIDEYAPNNSPSTGAEVVYPLSTPTTVQLTSVQVKTLLGNNNISADTGNINKLVYFKTGCEAIAKLIEAMIQ